MIVSRFVAVCLANPKSITIADDGTGYDQYPPINPSSRMFEITTEFKTVQSEGLILAVGQHGNYVR